MITNNGLILHKKYLTLFSTFSKSCDPMSNFFLNALLLMAKSQDPDKDKLGQSGLQSINKNNTEIHVLNNHLPFAFNKKFVQCMYSKTYSFAQFHARKRSTKTTYRKYG